MQQYNYLFILILGMCCLSSLKSNAQQTSREKSSEVLRPLLLDKSVLSGLGLRPIKLKDTPERKFFQKRLYGGKEISVYVVSSETWNVPFEKFWFDEFIYILNGEANVKSEEGIHNFKSNEYFFAPKGFKGEWQVKAGENLHYELSVITNQRADSTKISKYKIPQILDPSILSGVDIKFDESQIYENTLFEGIELTIKFKAEQPRTYKIEQPEKEKLICLLSGQLSFEDLNGEEMTFYSGDYFVIPQELKGTWKSEGHGLIKYFSVEKS